MKGDQAKLVTVSVATGLAGVAAGALSFVSFVDVRAFLQHLQAKNSDAIKKHFGLWWPCGRDFMVPLLLANTAAHGASYALTGDPAWLCSGACLFAVAPYTGLVLGEDIAKLRKADTEELEDTTRSFCRLHHVRTGLAVAGLGVSLSAMGAQFARRA